MNVIYGLKIAFFMSLAFLMRKSCFRKFFVCPVGLGEAKIMLSLPLPLSAAIPAAPLAQSLIPLGH